MDAVRAQVTYLKTGLDAYQKFFAGHDHFPVVYEDFYGSTIERKLDVAREVLAFCGLDPDNCNWDNVRRLVGSDNKVNRDYTVIPNYAEIVALGAADTGFL